MLGPRAQLYPVNPEWTDILYPNGLPLGNPNISPGGFVAHGSWVSYNSRGAVIEFEVPLVDPLGGANSGLLQWYLAYGEQNAALDIPEILDHTFNGAVINSLQAGTVNYRTVNLTPAGGGGAGVSCRVRVPINFPAFPNVRRISLYMRWDATVVAPAKDVYTYVYLSDEPLDITTFNTATSVPAGAATNPLVESKASPDPSSILGIVPTSTRLEPDGSQKTAALVRTDAGSFADDFHGVALARPLVGISQFTFGSTAVVGTITAYLTEVREGDYIYLDADGYTFAAQIASIDDNTHLTLASFYLGAGGAAAASSVMNYRVDFSGAASNVSVVNSLVTIEPGTAAVGTATIRRAIGVGGRKGFPPERAIWYASISQRIANQEAQLGFIGINPYTGATIPGTEAVFFFDGAVNTIVTCRTRSGTAAVDTLDEDVTIPGAGTSNLKHHYEILYYPDRVEFYIDYFRVAVHARHLPDPYQPLAQIE